MAVRDAEAAYQFLHDVFGAEKVEEEFANFLDGPYARVIHVGLGDVVLQFIEPRIEEGSWYEQLRDKGPGVHNLTFVVEDLRSVEEAMRRKGIEPLFTFPLDWGQLVGAENVRPGVPEVRMMNTMETLGFHLELGERPTDGEITFLHKSV
jgi:catechol 2,3-dioxygenase-like lactoylglutathione lyase family enzyme